MNKLILMSIFWPFLAVAAPSFDVVQHIELGMNPRTFEPLAPIGICSGSIVKIEGHLYELTAAHCVHQPMADVRFGVGQVFTDQLDKAVQEVRFDQRDYTRFDAADLALLKFDSAVSSETRVLELRQTQLMQNEVLTVNGYGGGKGPQKVKCRFQGDGVVYSKFIQSSGQPFVVPASGLVCGKPEDSNDDGVMDANDVEGFSGGPVLDSVNRVVGVVSSTPKMHTQQQMDVLMIPLTNSKLVHLERGVMLVPRERVISADYVNLDSLLLGLSIFTDVGSFHSKTCFDQHGLPHAYQLPVHGKPAIAFVRPSINIVSGEAGSRMIDAIDVHVETVAVNDASSAEAYAMALARWKNDCE